MAGTHPDTLAFSDDVNVPIDCYERHSRMIMPLGVASPRHPDHGTVNDAIRKDFLGSHQFVKAHVQLSPRPCDLRGGGARGGG